VTYLTPSSDENNRILPFAPPYQARRGSVKPRDERHDIEAVARSCRLYIE
jgi:hypothetical protein